MKTFDDYLDAETARLLNGNDPDENFLIKARQVCRIDAMEKLLRHAVESGQLKLPNNPNENAN